MRIALSTSDSDSSIKNDSAPPVIVIFSLPTLSVHNMCARGNLKQ